VETWGTIYRKIWRPKDIKLHATSLTDRECLRNEARCQSVNGVAKCDLSGTRTLSLVNFSLQAATNRKAVSTHTTGGHHNGHRQAFKCDLVSAQCSSWGLGGLGEHNETQVVISAALVATPASIPRIKQCMILHFL